MVDEIKTKPDSSRYLCFTKNEIDRPTEILAPEFDGMVKLWEDVYATMRRIVINRAPQYIHGKIYGITYPCSTTRRWESSAAPSSTAARCICPTSTTQRRCTS